MAKLDQVVTGDKLLYHDKEFRKKIKAEMPSKTSDLSNDDNTVKDASYVHTDNNYTTDEKDKLEGVEADADVNIIESISVNGTTQTVSESKSVDITMPTKVSDLSNDSKFQTEDEVAATVKEAVANSEHLKRKNVTTLPTTDIDTNTIYMVPDPKGKTGNEKIEYMYDADTSSWEQVGSSETDLDGYVKNTDLTEITNAQVDTIIAETFTDANA